MNEILKELINCYSPSLGKSLDRGKHCSEDVWKIMTGKRLEEMTAGDYVELMGGDLVGWTVETEAMGEYPGGPAEVRGVRPDPEATEIVLEVKHPTEGIMGIFESETLALLGKL